MPWDDRFSGEAQSPPVAFKDSYRHPIYEGETYYEIDDMCLCEKCARTYAFDLLKQAAKIRTAEVEH